MWKHKFHPDALAPHTPDYIPHARGAKRNTGDCMLRKQKHTNHTKRKESCSHALRVAATQALDDKPSPGQSPAPKSHKPQARPFTRALGVVETHALAARPAPSPGPAPKPQKTHANAFTHAIATLETHALDAGSSPGPGPTLKPQKA